jgi:menaquinol-cytochrome c reductase iron-sulfur subunit
MDEHVGYNKNTSSVIAAGELPGDDRRSFLFALMGVGAAFVGGLLSVPLIRFALFPLIRQTTQLKSSPVGAVSEFASLSEPALRTIQIEQVDGWRKSVTEKAVYVTTDKEGQLRVLSSVCPHLGCTVPWNKDRKEFVCPCHGGTFTKEGARVNGPSLRGMDPLQTSVENGQLLVKFQYFRQLVSDREVIG